MLICNDVYKSFGDVKVLNGVSLTVEQSEIVSIVGASGAGKSTLLQILGTLMPADRGDITIDGVKIGDLNANELADLRNRKIGFVFQFHHLLPEFDALENVMIPALIAKRPHGESVKRAKELLTVVGMSHRLDHKPSQLSGGEAQRVAIARALINNPAVIFADEPSGNLDSTNKAELHNLFFDLRKEFGTTFLIVTHDPHFAQQSDRIITIKDGIISQ